MAWLENAVKAAATVFGTGAWQQGQQTGTLAADVNIYDPVVAKSLVDGMTAGDLYATQPHLRTVVSFISRNGAQLGRHVYAKSENGRERVRGSAASELLSKPNSYMTGYDLFNMLFSELALYDMAIWVPVLRDGRWQIDPIPGEWVIGSKGEDAFRRKSYIIKYPDKPQPTAVPADQVIVFRGYNPHGFKAGSSPVRSLRSTLAEQVASMTFREQMWKRGGRVGMYMTRPKDAPVWSKEAKQKFIQNWRNSWSGTGANAGSTPLLEDGMELKRVGFTAKEEQWLEAATLSLSTVAGAYHVPPAMVGVQGAMSFASVKEFRKMLYTETMGPSIAQVEETINTFLFPFIGEPSDHYLELNIQEKLQGDFEEQAGVMQQAVGGPWMTVNEARERANLPKIDGGDALLAPLNMGAAGNNGPMAGEPIDQTPSEDSESADPDETEPKANGAHVAERGLDGRHICVKAPVEPDYGDVSDMSVAIKRVLKRQREEVKKALAAGKKADPEWWNQKKWNQELSALLQPAMTNLSAGVARTAAGAKGLDPDAYSVGRTAKFLKAVADSRADLINATTRDQIAKALDDVEDGDWEEAVEHVFEVSTESRAPESALTMSTMLTAWAVTEMARQLLADKGPKKTWIASGLPNSRHAGMDGETVGLDEPFSNGAQWPGDPVLGAEEVANCGCGVDITY